ncbi:hypothetical protein EfsSVR2281_34180 [Enterococcus faecalis]|nr:hypothetical protein EfsSVR2281_34180 [Enterococcus faecalis]
MNSFQAFTLREQDTSVIGQLETITLDDLSEGTVVIKAAYSSVNFKDSLASKKDGGVIRNYPMIPGIDVSGTVVTSEDPRFKEGDKVIVTGYQLGVSHTGGYSEYVRVPGDWVVPLPEKNESQRSNDLRNCWLYGRIICHSFRRRWLTRRQRSPHHCNWCDRRCCDIVYCDVASIRLHFNHCIN